MRFDIRKRGFEQVETQPLAGLSNTMAQYIGDRPHIRFSNIYRGCRKYFILHVLAVCTMIYLLYAFGGGKTNECLLFILSLH